MESLGCVSLTWVDTLQTASFVCFDGFWFWRFKIPCGEWNFELPEGKEAAVDADTRAFDGPSPVCLQWRLGGQSWKQVGQGCLNVFPKGLKISFCSKWTWMAACLRCGLNKYFDQTGLLMPLMERDYTVPSKQIEGNIHFIQVHCHGHRMCEWNYCAWHTSKNFCLESVCLVSGHWGTAGDEGAVQPLGGRKTFDRQAASLRNSTRALLKRGAFLSVLYGLIECKMLEP